MIRAYARPAFEGISEYVRTLDDMSLRKAESLRSTAPIVIDASSRREESRLPRRVPRVDPDLSMRLLPDYSHQNLFDIPVS